MSISFKNFLLEDTVKIKKWSEIAIGDVDATNLLNAHCKDGLNAIKNGGLLYRGMEVDHPGGFLKIDPSTGERTSRDSNNLYQLMFDNSSDLQDYPKRSKSLICSNTIEIAYSYGSAYVVFPYDGTELAVYDGSDFFKQKITSILFGLQDQTIKVPSISRLMAQFLLMCGITADVDSKFSSASKINSALSALNPIDIVHAYNSALEYAQQDFIVSHSSVNDPAARTDFFTYKKGSMLKQSTIDYFERVGFRNKGAALLYKIMKNNPSSRFTALASEIFRRDKLNIGLEKFGSYSYRPVPQEIWFSGPAILITQEVFADLLQQLKDKNFPIHSSILDAFKSLLK